jgi:hypothetical protein
MSEQGFDMGHAVDDEADDAAGEIGESVGRRQVLKRGAAGAAAAWAVPVIVTLAASPAGATSDPPTTGSTGQTQPTSGETQPTSGETQPTTGETEPTSGGTQGITATTGSTQTAQAPPTETTSTTSATTTTTRQTPGSAVTVGAQSGANPSGGLAFTGAEIGGLVVLGAGAVALGTAAVWTARHRDEQDNPDSPTPAVG